MKFIIASICLFLVLTFSLLANTEIGKVSFVKGNAWIEKDSTKKRVKIQKGDLLFKEDFIETMEKSLVIINFGINFKSQIKLGPKSKISMQEEIENNKNTGSVKTTNLLLKTGNVIVNFLNKDQKENLYVKTKTAALGVRGTTFFTDVGDGEQMSMGVDSGAVAVKSENNPKNVLVSKGLGTIVSNEGDILSPKKPKWFAYVNWNFDSSKGSLEHDAKLFKSIKQQYDAWNKEIEEQKKRWNDDIEEQRKRVFDN